MNIDNGPHEWEDLSGHQEAQQDLSREMLHRDNLGKILTRFAKTNSATISLFLLIEAFAANRLARERFAIAPTHHHGWEKC